MWLILYMESLKMKKTLLVLALAAAFAPALAQAEAGDWVVRARIVNVSPDESSKLDTTTNIFGAGAKLTVDTNTIPELDISYYFTKNIAAELILAIGTRHDVDIAGGTLAPGAKLGSVNMLPPTLTAQWHFNPDQTIDPYLGAGVNYTHAFDNNLNLGAVPIKIERNMFGLVAQAGVDINLKDGWLINADVKYVQMNTDVTADLGAGFVKIDDLDINPWVFGIGIGKKF
jgi:outer membrane protein